MAADIRLAAGSGDAETIAASLHEPEHFALVFDRHYAEIWSYLARRVGRGLADELTSETFLRAFAGRSSYDRGYPNARPWLYGIATNLLRKHVRAEERRRRAYARAAERDEVAGGLEAVAARLDAAAHAHALAGALAHMNPADRDTLLLLALTDLDYEGIAIATGVPVGTVRSRLHRVRRHLRPMVSDAPGDAITNRSQT